MAVDLYERRIWSTRTKSGTKRWLAASPKGLCFVYITGALTRAYGNAAKTAATVRDHVFMAEVKRNDELVALPDEWKERFRAKVEMWESEGAAAAQDQLVRLQGERQMLAAKIDRLNTAFADGAPDIAEFREMKNPLVC